jgi:hypothetical protein
MADEPGITIAGLFAAIHHKDKGWFDRLTEEQQQKFTTWVYHRWMSSVKHRNPDMQRYYLMATNKVINRDLSKLTKNHAKLAYLLMTSIPFDDDKIEHQWLVPMPQNKKNKAVNNKARVLATLNPAEKEDNLLALAELMTDAEFEALLVGHGWEPKKIKAELKK